LAAAQSAGPVPIGSVGQVGILVQDLNEAIDLYGRIFGIEEWNCYHYDQEFMPWSRFGAEEGAFAMRLAMGGSNPQIELIQPLAGPSIYHEFTEQGRTGLHHLGVFVDSLDAAITLMEGAGYRVTQTARGYGQAGDGGFAYFDTERDLGVVIEAIEIPASRRPATVRRTGGM
jgi:methylmalonyl-CoA/ethylmalonyl-CoA epimerase